MTPLLRSIIILICVAMPTMAESDPWFPSSSSPTGDVVDVIDLRDATADDKLLATTLQGLVNGGDEARLYLLLGAEDPFWLEHMRDRNHIRAYRNISIADALSHYADRIKTLVIYDPELPATINIATMAASLEQGIVVAPEFRWEGAGMPDVDDLRGRWDTNVAAYRWAFDALYPRMNQRLLACYHPTACNHHLRDYLTRHRVFHFWVTSREAADGVRADFEAEKALCVEILAATPSNIPVLGFWYSGVDRGLDEYDGVGLAGRHGKITVVADWSTNLSFLSGVPVALADAVAAYQGREIAEPPELDADRVYICYDIVESGDAPVYVQDRQRRVWADGQRGVLPINWSLGPAIFDLAPVIAAYYYDQATPNDYLYMAISGAGYCHPYRAFMADTDQPEAAWRAYLGLTGAYLERMGCRTLGLYTDAWRPYDRAIQDSVTRRFIEGLPGLEAVILGMGRDEGVSPEAANYYLGEDKSALVSHIMTRWPTDYAARTRKENIAWLAQDIQDHTPETRPAFIHVMALSWVFGPSEIVETHRRLGDSYVPLTAPQFTRLYAIHSNKQQEP